MCNHADTETTCMYFCMYARIHTPQQQTQQKQNYNQHITPCHTGYFSATQPRLLGMRLLQQPHVTLHDLLPCCPPHSLPRPPHGHAPGYAGVGYTNRGVCCNRLHGSTGGRVLPQLVFHRWVGGNTHHMGAVAAVCRGVCGGGTCVHADTGDAEAEAGEGGVGGAAMLCGVVECCECVGGGPEGSLGAWHGMCWVGGECGMCEGYVGKVGGASG